ncbi:MAG TPA: hypothetical protein DCX27_19435 [Balneola sp.]|nr:hypothetical protein [Balneola sp.]|tara:strand:+ start:9042 stop:9803 length:762 start_codon:yes stop_codon:yes gene_type:complete
MKKILNEWNKFILKEASQFRDIIRILTGDRQNIQSVGMMTPENPDAQQLSPEDNARLIKDFIRKLREMNLGYKKIRGKFGNKERSFIIPNISREEMVQLGKDYGQEAVIWGSMQDGKMVYEYIEGDNTIQKRDIVLSGPDVDAKSDFYSQEPGGPEGHRITYGNDPKTGERKAITQGPAKKFIIPFFDEEYDFEEDGPGEGILSELNLVTERQLYEDTKRRLKIILKENVTKKSRWQNRRIIKYNYSKRVNNI